MLVCTVSSNREIALIPSEISLGMEIQAAFESIAMD